LLAHLLDLSYQIRLDNQHGLEFVPQLHDLALALLKRSPQSACFSAVAIFDV
jgi:hypothetical protein